MRHEGVKSFPGWASTNAARTAGWRRLTLKGNLAIEEGHDIRARPFFEEALSEAEQLFAAAVLADDEDAARFAHALYGISCNDIAELARRQGDEVKWAFATGGVADTRGHWLFFNLADPWAASGVRDQSQVDDLDPAETGQGAR